MGAKLRLWATLAAMSCAGSLAGVGALHSPLLQEPLRLLLLAGLLPLGVVLLLGWLRPVMGTVVAFLIPVGWMLRVSRPDDPAWPWLIPLAFGLAVIFTAKIGRAQIVPGPIALGAFLLLAASILFCVL